MDALEAAGKPPLIVIPFATLRWPVLHSTPGDEPNPLFEMWREATARAEAEPPADLAAYGQEVMLNAAGIPRELYAGAARLGSSQPAADFFNRALGVDWARGQSVTAVQTFDDAARLLTGGLVETGAYELETTEFTPAGEYTPGEDAVRLSPEQALRITQSWGRDEIDETTRRELRESMAAERPRPRPADCVRARIFNNRAVISWESSGAHVEKWYIERAIDGEDFEVIAEMPATARKYVDYDHDHDLHFEYYIRACPEPRQFIVRALSRVVIPPCARTPMRERLDWQARECCMMMFNMPYYPGIERYRNLRESTRRIVSSLVQLSMQRDVLQTIASRGAWSTMPFFRPDMP